MTSRFCSRLLTFHYRARDEKSFYIVDPFFTLTGGREPALRDCAERLSSLSFIPFHPELCVLSAICLSQHALYLHMLSPIFLWFHHQRVPQYCPCHE